MENPGAVGARGAFGCVGLAGFDASKDTVPPRHHQARILVRRALFEEVR